MKRKLFLSLLSTTPLIGVMPGKKTALNNKKLYKIQFTTKEMFGNAGDISVLFHGDKNIYIMGDGPYTFDEFQSIAKHFIKEPFSIGRNLHKYIYVNKEALFGSDKIFL